jgi:hypothetical protein
MPARLLRAINYIQFSTERFVLEATRKRTERQETHAPAGFFV